jgi:hypothetical protein
MKATDHTSDKNALPKGASTYESPQLRFGNLEGYVRSPVRGLGVAKGDLT